MNNTLNKLIIPLSIIIAGGLIAGGIYFSQRSPKGPTNIGDIAAAAAKPKIEVAPVTDADHILGKRDAKIVIINYTDTECPFCKQFHATLNQIAAEYKDSGKVALVYRHFPLAALHSRAPKEAEATECAQELGGTDAFWKYTDMVYQQTPTNNGLDPAKLIDFAEAVNLDKVKFKACLDSGKYAQKVADAVQAAYKAGGEGTPYTVIQFKGENIPLVDSQGSGMGALPYTSMKAIIEQLLKS